MDNTQNQDDVQKMVIALEAILHNVEVSKAHVDESLRLINEQTASAHASLQQNEADIKAGKAAANQKLAALVKQARQ